MPEGWDGNRPSYAELAHIVWSARVRRNELGGEVRIPLTPSDICQLNENGVLDVAVHYHVLDEAGDLQLRTFEWRGSPTGLTEIPPFQYIKPVQSDPEDSFAVEYMPEVNSEGTRKMRTGYYLLGVVEIEEGFFGPLRGPNHWAGPSSHTIVALVNTGTDAEPKWETRLFPLASIAKEDRLGVFEVLVRSGLYEVVDGKLVARK